MSLLAQFGIPQKILRPTGGCRNCPLRDRKATCFVPATLKKGKVLFLGEAPGATDVKEREPFAGSGGQILKRLAAEANVPGPWSFSTAVHCGLEGNGKPGSREAERCLSQFVLDEVRGYDWVVMAGATPLQTLFPGGKANRYRGNVAWHPDFPGQRFFAIYHPSYVLRRPDVEGELKRQLARLGRLVRGEDVVPWKVLVGGGDEYWDALDRALASPLISLDFETNKLESWHADARITAGAVTHDAQTVIAAHESDPGWLGFLEKIKAYLLNPAKQVVGANTGFDLDFVERELEFRIATRAIHDTMPVWYEAGQYKMPSLKQLVSEQGDGYRFLVYQPSEEADKDLLLRYNAEDVVHPLHLLREGLARVKPRTRDLLIRVSSPAGYVLRKMGSNGIYLRQDYWREKKKEYAEKKEAALVAWAEEDPDFVPALHTTGDGLITYLYKVKGLPVLQRTGKTAKPATDKSVVKALARDHGAPYLRHLLKLKELEKIESTYLTAYEKVIDPHDGRIHSSYPHTWTDTGRSSSRKPNLQNIPRNREIRDLFGPRPGGVLLESDLSQIEFRIMVCLARDANGIAGFRRGDDAHTMTARSFCKGDEPTKEERNQAKAINFALLFEGDWRNVQRVALDWYGLRWSEEECKDFVTAFFQTYPGIPELHRQAHAELTRNRGWFESVTGHVYHYEDWNHEDRGKRDHAHRAAINSRAQGPAAQLCFYIAIHADRLLVERGMEDVLLVNTVHDSILFDIPKPELLGPVIACVEEGRELAALWAQDWLTVPLVMDHEAGPSWGSLKKWAV